MSYLDRLKALDMEKSPLSLLPKLSEAPFGSNDSSAAEQKAKIAAPRQSTPAADFWAKVARVRPCHSDFIHHLMACRRCWAPRGRYCSVGRRLHEQLQAAWTAADIEAI